MKKLLTAFFLLLAALTLLLPRPALAVDLANGAQIFTNKCAACHLGGGNVVNGEKTLKQETLEKFGMNSAEAIIAQVTNGKNAMPKFGGQLSEAEIQNVAAYVLDQAAKGWK
ncbi:MAG: c-type cytochrome [Merismopediaceae bacterium]|nr:c-type cytochrome [Merismopediaceae bacterium]